MNFAQFVDMTRPEKLEFCQSNKHHSDRQRQIGRRADRQKEGWEVRRRGGGGSGSVLMATTTDKVASIAD